MHRFGPLLLLILIIPLIEGCSDDPNATGIALIPKVDAITIAADTISAISSTTDTAHIQGTSITLLVGKFHLPLGTRTLEARTLMEFDGIPTDKPLAIIDSAVLTLHVNYRFKDSTGEFGFEVHRLDTSWNSTSLTWANLVPDSLYNDTIAISFSNFIGVQDTILRVDIKPVVQSWFQAQSSTPYGVILIPSPTVISNLVLGFSNFINTVGDFRPQLTIGYNNSPAGDTNSFTLTPSQVLFLANSDQPLPTNTLYVQAGIAYRGRVKFDFSSLPKGISITSTTMNLFLNTSASLRNAYTVNSIEAQPALDSTSLPALSTLAAIGTPDSTDTTKFKFDVKSFVQQWIATTPTPNYGMMLRASDEYTSLDGFVFYGAFADSAHRPRLTITYTKFPQKTHRANR